MKLNTKSQGPRAVDSRSRALHQQVHSRKINMKPSLVMVWSILAIASLYGCNRNSTQAVDGLGPKEAAAEPMTSRTATADAQIVPITVNEDGFVPNNVEVKQGSKATLRFTRTTDKTCATAVAFPEWKLEKPLPLNQAVDIVIPSDKPRTLTFQCGMGMFKSKVVVQ
jgi:hypothetical protein